MCAKCLSIGLPATIALKAVLRAERIGTLNITPDLLQSLLDGDGERKP